jgi:hypothetical protein
MWRDRVRNFIVILLIILVSACSDTRHGQSAKSLPDNQENRMVVAKRFLKVMPPKEMLEALTKRVVQTLPEKDRKPFMEVMSSEGIEQVTYRITLDGLIKHFTVGELNAMDAFYGSPEGHSAYMKLSAYMSDIMPQIQQEVKKAVMEAQKQQQPQEQQQPKGSAQPPGKEEQKKPQSKK